MQPTETTQLGEPAIESIIAELDAEYTGKLPEEAIRAARENRDEIIPRLIDSIRQASQTFLDEGDTQSNGHFFALYLLAEFRAKEALPAIVEAISLPDDGPYTLFGDAITESLPAILAALAVDSRKVVEDLIVGREINEYVRSAAARTYLYWVRDAVMTRDEAVERLRGHLRAAIAGNDAEFTGWLVNSLADYGAPESMEEIQEAYRRDLVDCFLIDLNDVNDCMARGEAEFQRNLERCGDTGVTDLIEVLSRWHFFSGETVDSFSPNGGLPLPNGFDPFPTAKPGDEYDEPRGPLEPLRNAAPKVGRNDPCPCGSGKKFKKCCGGG
jgi:hypothetical protein